MTYDDVSQSVTEILKQLMSLLEIEAIYDLQDVTREEEPEHIRVDAHIHTESANMLIGYHGETLQSLQHITNSILYRQFQDHASVILDVEGYRREREKKLVEVAENASQKARFLNKPVALYPMSSYERKIIHEHVAKLSGVASASEGEGASRRVIITPEQ